MYNAMTYIYIYTQNELKYTYKCACTDTQNEMTYISDTYTEVAYIIFILYYINSYIYGEELHGIYI